VHYAQLILESANPKIFPFNFMFAFFIDFSCYIYCNEDFKTLVKIVYFDEGCFSGKNAKKRGS